jgi:hypothetical protein
VTLCFRFKSNGEASFDKAEGLKNIKRKFSKTTTLSALFDFMESLDFTDNQESVEIFCCFPRSLKLKRSSSDAVLQTLTEAGITENTVVWVTYEG